MGAIGVEEKNLPRFGFDFDFLHALKKRVSLFFLPL